MAEGSAGIQALVDQVKGLLEQAAIDNLETSKKIIPSATKRQIAGALPKQ